MTVTPALSQTDRLKILTAERARLVAKSNELAARKTKLRGARDEATALRNELAQLGAKESAELEQWLAAGQQGEEPQPHHARRREITVRLAALRDNGRDVGGSLAQIEQDEARINACAVELASAIESETLAQFIAELEAAHKDALKTARAFGLAIAKFEGLRTVVSALGEQHKREGRPELHGRACRATTELYRLTGRDHLETVSSDEMHFALRQARERLNAIGAQG